MSLSICLAVYNEEGNIGDCLKSVKGLADEIVVVDGGSIDQTIELAKKFGAKVILTDNPPMFHINKQKALDAATGDWILQLDADERVTPELAEEIKKVISMNKKELEEYEENLPEKELFLKHQNLIDNRQNGGLSRFPSRQGSSPQIKPRRLHAAGIPANSTPILPYSVFYLARKNFFLGKFLRYGGVYPDGVIRLVKKGKARFPCRDVHELMEVDGLVGWLKNPLLHYDSPTFKRYLQRNNRYIDLMVSEFRNKKLKKNFMNFMKFVLYKPLGWFFSTTIIHKGILDGWQGIVFSFFSALRFPRAYVRLLKK